MNKQLIAQSFSKAADTYTQEAGVQQQIAERMICLLHPYLPAPGARVLEFGCGTGSYSRLLLRYLRPAELLLNDLCPAMEQQCEELLQANGVAFLTGDAEALPFPDNCTLITSCSALQWFDAPGRFFEKCAAALAPHGYLAFSTFGPENMKEVRRLTGNGLPYRTRTELEQLLQNAQFDILYSEEEEIPLPFEHPMKVLYHLKRTGVNGVQKTSPHRWTRLDMQEFCEEYIRLFGRQSALQPTVSLTYHPIYIIARKRE
jgi:malonyl-CoA O-methyltransferase/biotin synthesis protein BioG